ncbi:MAG: helix-turn-helix domain-containing protein [Proteobacteria bacterium]|nr:helix-turn-helix domain-containing protein [Pseudomonadota bacterium]
MQYSEDLRRRVVKYVRQGKSKAEAARQFGVSRPTIYEWLALGDNLSSQKPGPKKAYKLDWVSLRAGVDKQPEKMITEWAKEFGVVPGTIHYAMHQMRLSRKKSVAV